jgi:hypothetical protein
MTFLINTIKDLHDHEKHIRTDISVHDGNDVSYKRPIVSSKPDIIFIFCTA